MSAAGYADFLFWKIPAAVLVLLALDKVPSFRPKRDASVLALCFPALAVPGFILAAASAHAGSPAPSLPLPAGLSGWAGAVLLSLSSGFLEEAYFRVYFPQRIRAALLKKGVPSPGLREGYSLKGGLFPEGASFVIPLLVFALCHIWEGPWGTANALIAGAVLALAYNKTVSFYGIAAAHGLYNVLVYLAAVLNT